MYRVETTVSSALLRKLDKYKNFLRKASKKKLTRSDIIRGILENYLTENPVVELERKEK